ncbi:hypothetical protein [Mycoplasma sp. CSL7503-lung]|uniref:hypothetical protein n=1 Tax=Mycoplasma sp. CSL7503-lung TaxID=536372 RepID=UPI0021CEBD63|nr:hypothetical protein [Mycoplasma sp. CSL7503-lung]MCU4706414.1 hypothetical protein [Mycoplasma sp. CSL7503-lung]
MKSIYSILFHLGNLTSLPTLASSGVSQSSQSSYTNDEFNKIKEDYKKLFNKYFTNNNFNSQIDSIQNTTKEQVKNKVVEILKNTYINIISDIFFAQSNNNYNSTELERTIKEKINNNNNFEIDIWDQMIASVLVDLGHKWIDEARENFTYSELMNDLQKSKWTIKQENKTAYQYWSNIARTIFSGFYVDSINGDSWFSEDEIEHSQEETERIYFKNAIEPKLYLLNIDPELKHDNKSLDLSNNEEIKTLISKLNLSDLSTYKALLNKYAYLFKSDLYRYHKDVDYSFNEIWMINPAIVFKNESILDENSIPYNKVINFIKNYYIEDVLEMLNLNLGDDFLNNWPTNINFDNKLNDNASLIYYNLSLPLINHLKIQVFNSIFDYYNISQNEQNRIWSLFQQTPQERNFLFDTVGIYELSDKKILSATRPKVSFFNLKLKIQEVLNEIGKIVKPELNIVNENFRFHNYTLNEILPKNKDRGETKLDNENYSDDNLEKSNDKDVNTSIEEKNGSNKEKSNQNSNKKNVTPKDNIQKTDESKTTNQKSRDKNSNDSEKNIEKEKNKGSSNYNIKKFLLIALIALGIISSGTIFLLILRKKMLSK